MLNNQRIHVSRHPHLRVQQTQGFLWNCDITYINSPVEEWNSWVWTTLPTSWYRALPPPWSFQLWSLTVARLSERCGPNLVVNTKMDITNRESSWERDKQTLIHSKHLDVIKDPNSQTHKTVFCQQVQQEPIIIGIVTILRAKHVMIHLNKHWKQFNGLVSVFWWFLMVSDLQTMSQSC